MHPDWLEAFVALADHGTFAEASRILSRAQPTVHVQVQKLAEHLGVTLYQRSGRGIELTDEGRNVVAFARETLARNLAFKSVLQGAQSERPVVLTAGEGAFLYLLGPAIRRFGKAETVGLRLWVGAEPDVQTRTLDGRADIAVTTTAPSQGLLAQQLAESKLCLAMPAAHALAGRKRLRFADLQGLDWVAPDAGRPLRTLMERSAAHAGFELNVVVQARGWPLILHFVALGIGVALVNSVCALPRGVVACPVVDLDGLNYWAVRRPDANHRPEVERLWRCLSRG